jgi:hypothetical protein
MRQIRRDADDFRDALGHRSPGDAGGQLAAQHRVVDVAGGGCVPEQRPGVDRAPVPVTPLQQVRDHDVGVQLRVVRPAGVVAERGGDEPVGADPRGTLAVTLVAAEPV